MPVGGLSFGAVGVGQSALSQTVTLTNNGGAALTVASLTANGDFYLVPGSSTCGQPGASLAPGAACSVAVGFLPSAAGPRAGVLTVADSALNSPQSLALSGIGVDFTLAPDGPVTATVSSGKTASYLLLLSSAASLSGAVPLTCSGVPANAICTVSPATAPLGSTTVITVTVATGLSTVRLDLPALPGSGGKNAELAVTFAGLGLLALLLPRRSMRRTGVSVLLLTGLLMATACSSPRTIPASQDPSTPIVTPSGSYNLTVAGSSAGVVRSVNLTLIVQ